MAMLETVKEHLHFKTEWQIIKFRDPDNKIANLMQAGLPTHIALRRFKNRLIGIETIRGNLALNEGIQLLLEIISGIDTTSNKWDNTHAYLGVGDSNTTASATQTGLQGTNKTFKGMDTGYPQRSNQTLEWRATYGTTEGNHSWQEFTVVNASDDTGKNLNRKVEDKGTKASGETWTLSLKITCS
jgi:hypothetical protein